MSPTIVHRSSGILSCEEMNLFWSSAEFRQLQLDQNEEEKKKKIIVKKGTLLKFFFPKVYDVVAKEVSKYCLVFFELAYLLLIRNRRRI